MRIVHLFCHSLLSSLVLLMSMETTACVRILPLRCVIVCLLWRIGRGPSHVLLYMVLLDAFNLA